jgi:hypothetical protein
MLTKDELFVVEAIEGDEDNGDDPTPSNFQDDTEEEDDVYGDGGLGLRALLDAE